MRLQALHHAVNTTSASLLHSLRQPNAQQAWARFVDLYTPLIYYWARRVGLQEQDAADLVQEVFAVLIRKLPEFTYERHRSFRSWLRTVTLNKWRELHRRRAGAPVRDDDVFVADLPDPAPSAWEEAEYQQYLINRALELVQHEFQPVTWKAFRECVVGGRPAAAVAVELGISVNAVYIAKSRVLAWLRCQLDRLLD